MSKARTSRNPSHRSGDASTEQDYDIFEVLPGGSLRWQGTVKGIDSVMPKLIELAGDTKKELFAHCFTTREIVARINARGPS